jgi:hypothetical protein
LASLIKQHAKPRIGGRRNRIKTSVSDIDFWLTIMVTVPSAIT